MVTDVTYKELATVCGRHAYEALLAIEKSAQVGKSQVIQFNCEQRLYRAFEAMRKSELSLK